jgi:hypothetical protein
MFALPGILALIAFIYLRPHEVFSFLGRVPCIPILFAVTLLGLVLDLRLRLSHLRPAPHALLAVACTSGRWSRPPWAPPLRLATWLRP